MKRELIAGLRAMPGVESVAETFVVPLERQQVHERGLAGRRHARRRPRRLLQPRLARLLRDARHAARRRPRHRRHRHGLDARSSRSSTRRSRACCCPGVSPIGRRFRVEATPTSPERAVRDRRPGRRREVPPAARRAPAGHFVAILQRGGNAAGGVYVAAHGHDAPGLRAGRARRAGPRRPAPALRRPRPRGRHPRHAAARPRDGAAVVAASACLAALLAAVGLHGVAAYGIERRRREIGIRLALGADRRRIVASVLRENGRLVAAGLGVGTVLALVVTAAARGCSSASSRATRRR